jgi:predicted enzyme related to lactoylglutathione lyase
MPERKEYAPGTPSWVDLQTSDQNAAKRFYSELFGWTYNDQEVPDSGGAVYSMAQLNGHDVAAIAGMPPGADGIPPHWNTYITVSDADATCGVVEKAGGTVLMPPFDIMDAGRMAVIVDPTGAVFNIWQAKNHPGAGLVNDPGAWSWNELLTPDVSKAAEFYGKVFGWEANHITEGMEYTEFKLNGQSIAGGMKPPMPGLPPSWQVYFSVDDTDASFAKAVSLGATSFREPTDIPPGRFAVLADPQGAVFHIIKMTREVS